LVDIGTGSGALAISAKLTYPRFRVTAIDVSRDALTVAKQNAFNLNADIRFIESNLMHAVNDKVDIILANLPYIPPDYELSEDIKYEPTLALYADNGGLLLIEQLIKQAAQKLNIGGHILIESLPSQFNRIDKIAKKHDLQLVKRTGIIQVYKYWP
jgi:release factor glutamine methyltransferase